MRGVQWGLTPLLLWCTAFLIHACPPPLYALSPPPVTYNYALVRTPHTVGSQSRALAEKYPPNSLWNIITGSPT